MKGTDEMCVCWGCVKGTDAVSVYVCVCVCVCFFVCVCACVCRGCVNGTDGVCDTPGIFSHNQSHILPFVRRNWGVQE